MQHTLLRFGKYTVVGVLTFSLDLLLLFIIVDIFLIDQILASGIAFLIAVSVNYHISRTYVFRRTLRSVGSGYVNFLGIAAGGLLLVVGGMFVLTMWFGWNYLLARLTVAFITGFWNYLMNLYVNFKVIGKH